MPDRLRTAIVPAIVLMWLCVACQDVTGSGVPTATLAGVSPAMTATTTLTATPATLQPTRTTQPLPATVTPSATALPSSTPTPPQLFFVAVPPFWEQETLAAVAATGAGTRWQVVTSGDPQLMLDQAAAQAALLPGDEGFFAGNRPLALAVPFTTDWDGVTLPQAQDIQANGHELVSLLPWHALTPDQRALIIDGRHIAEPDYPLQQPWSLLALPGAEEPAALLAQQLQRIARPGDVQLAAVGDIMLDRGLGSSIAAGDVDFPFSFVASTLREADFTVGNLECALGDVGEPAAKSYTFRAPPLAARSISQAGFDLVSLANNHALDFGPQALMQGLELLKAEGVATVGAGADNESAHRSHIVQINGITLGFLGYVNVPVEGNPPYFDTASWTAGTQAPGLAWADPQIVAADVQNLSNDVDHVIVILHSGYEYVAPPSPDQAASAHAAIDAGASLVIGHHAHILQGVEFRGEGIIVYGLGNFAFNITGPAQTAILNVWFDEIGIRQLRFLPAVVLGSGQPRLVDEPEAAGIRTQIYALSRGLN